MSDSSTVWCLLGKKAGDNTQVLALARELGLGYVEKHITARSWELLPHLLLRRTLAGIDRAASSELEAPWPDLVISAGRRNEPVARWIQKRSGGATRLVHIGRPWAEPDCYDLVISTPQYFLDGRPGVLVNSLPLLRRDTAELSGESARLLPRIQHLPRPWVAVLVGGDSGKYVLTPGKAESLGHAAIALASYQGGSLLVTDSPRTPRRAGDTLQGMLREQDYCYRWGEGGDNPYQGLLALADAFVVTGESMSMLAEAFSTGKPLHIFDPADAGRWWLQAHNYRYKPLSHRLAMTFGPKRMRRDVGRIQEALVASGQAAWLKDSGQEFPVFKLAPSQAGDSSTRSPGQFDAARDPGRELKVSALAVRRRLAAS